MALSNILREPRREITESSIGVLMVMAIGLAPIWGAWRFAVWFQLVSGGVDHGCPRGLGLVIGILAEVLAFGIASIFLLFTHAIGEDVCDAMARRGFDPRPKDRTP